jgi:hypothetical protein
MGCMNEVHFWLDDWEHECCGDHRKVGDRIKVPLWFEDLAVTTDDEPVVKALPDGLMVVVGDVVNRKQSQPFLLVDAGQLTVACRQRFDGTRVRCEGRLWEERHEDSVPTVKGTVIGMRWHKGLYEKTKEGHRRIGFAEPTVIYNTDKFPGYPVPESPNLRKARENVRSGKAKGRITYKAAPMEDFVPAGWAFEFIIEV